MKTILIYSRSLLSRDPRIGRQIDALVGHYRLVVVGLGPYDPPKDVGFIDLEPLIVKLPSLRMALFDRHLARSPLWYLKWALFKLLSKMPVMLGIRARIETSLRFGPAVRMISEVDRDLTIANDFDSLPVVAAAGRKGKLLFDAHEFAPAQYDGDRRWEFRNKPYVDYLLRRLLPLCDGMMTVNKGIAREYERRYGRAFEVVTNAPRFENLVPRNPADGTIRMVHHGGAIPMRGLETMIEMMGALDPRFSLTFYLVGGDARYNEKLHALSAGNARISFAAPVKMQELPRTLNAYDIGLYILRPTNFNTLHALPNKLFEFVQARLMVAVGPSPEMASCVREWELGIVAEDFSPSCMARALSGLTSERIMHYKRKAHAHANELSAKPNLRKLQDMVTALIGR